MNRNNVMVSVLTLAAFALTPAIAQTASSSREAQDSSKALAAPANEQVKAPVAAANEPAKAPAAAQGVVVFKDPDTGVVRQPSAAEIGDLLAAQPGGTSTQSQAISARPATSQPVAIRGLPRGTEGMRLGADTMVNTVVTKTPDGKLVQSEVIGDKAAAATVTSESKPAAAKSEK